MARVEKARMPRWMRRRVMCGPALRRVEEVLAEEGLATVCVGARCPNLGECYCAGTATFMILGDRCTRDCRFCAVPPGEGRPPDPGEPEAVARAASRLGLEHVVVTSVTRDDLEGGGAGQFASTVEAVREALPGATVEVLIPDFLGDPAAVDKVIKAGPDVFNHNLETVRRLYPRVRPQAEYGRSLAVLSRGREAGLLTKSGFMVGFGESSEEIDELMGDLLAAGCRLLTVGQYLRPTAESAQVSRYYRPGEFETLREKALGMGFEAVAAGLYVRSSYFAGEMFESVRDKRTAGIRKRYSQEEMARR
ncbi:MAG: lipoyl synthase [Actinomycetia bacterium]|nr:lipoyl synthase [Actinomycetes bacterium]